MTLVMQNKYVSSRMQFPMKTNVSKIEVDSSNRHNKEYFRCPAFSSSNIEQKSNEYLLQHE